MIPDQGASNLPNRGRDERGKDYRDRISVLLEVLKVERQHSRTKLGLEGYLGARILDFIRKVSMVVTRGSKTDREDRRAASDRVQYNTF